jgi:menaquinone-dependent protoporphyrinogen oxidase
MTVLIGYASALGSTREIAEHIGRKLTEHDLHADVRAIEEVESAEKHEAFILGSAVHDMTWLPPAVSFVRTHQAELAHRPVWLFSVGSKDSLRGPIGRRLASRYPIPKGIAELQDSLDLRGHQILTGVIRRDQYPRLSRIVLRLLGGGYGDFRDWKQIDTWTESIARTLADHSDTP